MALRQKTRRSLLKLAAATLFVTPLLNSRLSHAFAMYRRDATYRFDLFRRRLRANPAGMDRILDVARQHLGSDALRSTLWSTHLPNGGKVDDAAIADIAAAILEDRANGRTIMVDGWPVTHTEIGLVALARGRSGTHVA